MGKNRKWVLEDKLSEAVWRTIRGPRPPGTPSPNSVTRRPSTKPPEKSSPVPSKRGKGKGQPKGDGRGSSSKEHHSLNPDEQLKAAQVRVAKFEAALLALGEEDPAAVGLKQALTKARIQVQVRPVQDRVAQTEAFLVQSRKKLESMVVEAEKIRLDIKELEAKIQDGERRLDALRVEAKAQPSPFTVTSDPQGDSSTAIEDCTDGSISRRRLHPGGVPDQETQDSGRFFPRFGAFGRRRASQGECFDVQFDRPSRRVDEAVRVVVGARDSLFGSSG